jgi:hypothetical protein
VEPQEAEQRGAARRFGCILGIVVLGLLALPFLMKLWP